MKAKRKDLASATDALIAWFKSQDISPDEAVPIMASTMCVCVISIMAEDKHELTDAVTGVQAASRLVLETFRDQFLNEDEQ